MTYSFYLIKYYYNITALGLLNFVKDHVGVVTHKVPPSTLTIWSLSWILMVGWMVLITIQNRNF